MKRGQIILVLALLLGVAGYVIVRWRQGTAELVYGETYAQHGVDGHHAELDWLRSELKVSEEQMARINDLHVAYHPVCEELAHRLEASHRRLNGLTDTATSVSPELEEALKEHGSLHVECQKAMLKHFYETAACLSPEQARRYLDTMLPFVFLHDTVSSAEHPH